MTIPVTITKTFIRPFANVSLPTDTGTIESIAHTQGYAAAKQAFINAGNIVQTQTTSSDGLTTTVTIVCDNLTTYSSLDTALDIGTRAEYMDHSNLTGLSNSTLLSGISQSFTSTNVYTFPTAGLPVHDDLSAALSNNSNGKLSNLIVTGTSITATHTYNNSDDFNVNYWKDSYLVQKLHTAGATRTITYALV